MEAWEGRKAQERPLEAAELSKTSWYSEQHQEAVLDKQTLTVLRGVCAPSLQRVLINPTCNYRKEIGHVSYPVKKWEKLEMLAQEYSENINSRTTMMKSST